MGPMPFNYAIPTRQEGGVLKWCVHVLQKVLLVEGCDSKGCFPGVKMMQMIKLSSPTGQMLFPLESSRVVGLLNLSPCAITFVLCRPKF